ncbi:MAG: 2-phospho-L-lactate guanylyltransferase, partial [Solirubrobacterales bacterium]|nr:2-phospho-L-lactate guanylyltransferase [Solirubrobacterales bacterium]
MTPRASASADAARREARRSGAIFAILPVKRFDAAKQRLDHELSGGTRRALAEAMVTDVLTALRRTEAVDAVLLVTAEPAAEAIGRGYGARVLHDDQQAGQSAATQIGLRHAIEAGATRALLVPGDTPALDPAELGALLARRPAGPADLVIVPDRHGTGTNALLIAPPRAIIPSFGPGSLARHEAAAVAAARRLGATIASHDDTTEAQVAASRAIGVAVAEF